MKRVISLAIALSIALTHFQGASAGSVEVTQQFKEVALAIAKEEFRDFLFKRIQSQDLCLSIAIYDLLGKLIYSNKYDELSGLIVESYVDYIFLLKVKSHLRTLLESKEKEGARFVKRPPKASADPSEPAQESASDEDAEVAESTEPVTDGVSKSTATVAVEIKLTKDQKKARDELLSFSALYWYTLSRKHAGLPVTHYLLDLLEQNNQRFDFLIVFPEKSQKPNQFWKWRVLRELSDKKFKKGINVRYPELIKFVLGELLESEDGWEARVTKAYKDFQTQVGTKDEEAKEATAEEPASDDGKDKAQEDRARVEKIIKKLKNDFRKTATKEERAAEGEGGKFLAVVSSYALGLFDKPTEAYRDIDAERFVNDILELFQSLESQRSKKGFGFAVGLWYGAFFSGQEWVNEDQTKREYPVQSFRVNDRLQYTFAAGKGGSAFLYGGGIVDALTSNLFNKENKKFFYAGIGVKPKFLWDLAICYSAALPPTFSKRNVVGSVVSVMYDVPITKVMKILMKKGQ